MPKAQLLELYARGLGVIEEARVSFGPHFNVVTGETGAGKTLLLGALELCLGGDATASRYAVTTDTRAVAVFGRDDGSEMVFARESSSTGRLRSSLDGAPSSAELLRSAATDVIVIHGQHDSLSLRSRVEVLRIVDLAGSIRTDDLDDVRNALREAHAQRVVLGGDPAQRDREREFLLFQAAELRAAAIRDDAELDNVFGELRRLSSLRDGQAALAAVLAALDGDVDDPVLGRLAQVLAQIPAGDAYDDARATLRSALEQARDGVHQLATLANPDLIDERALNELDERAGQLQAIARKYGGSLASALEKLAAIERSIEDLDSAGERLRVLDATILELEETERELSRRVRRDRDYAAVRLTEAVRRQLPRVALPHASLRFAIDGADGSDAQILFTPNPGQPEGPLQALASGGELSRVLLALSLETSTDAVVAVFDEVDAGVGGQVAQQIGQCLAEVGQRQQVIAVTHLASVAARAQHHFVIEKTVTDGITSTTVREVRGDDRLREVARMLAGDEVTAEALALAQRLVESGR